MLGTEILSLAIILHKNFCTNPNCVFHEEMDPLQPWIHLWDEQEHQLYLNETQVLLEQYSIDELRKILISGKLPEQPKVINIDILDQEGQLGLDNCLCPQLK